MISEEQCLYSTPIDIPQRLRSLSQQSSDSRLNRALTYVAQEVAGQLQRSHPLTVTRNNNHVETSARKSARARIQVHHHR